MQRMTGIMAVVAALVAGGAAVAEAQNAHIGSHLAYQFDVRDPAVGAQATLPVVSQFDFYPSGAVYLVDQGSLMAFNADMKYRLPAIAYVGGGLNLLRRNVNDVGRTDAGVNLLGGVEGRTGRIHPFAEGRVILNEGSAFQLAGGVNIALRP